MKNTILIIITIFIVILGTVCGLVVSEKNKKNEIAKTNKYYENYLNKEIYGTELATIIGWATEQNIKNGIQKDEKGLFIENDTNSLKINIKMVTKDVTFPMEIFLSSSIENFVSNFNIIKFKCINIEYHQKTGLISKITFEEIEEIY